MSVPPVGLRFAHDCIGHGVKGKRHARVGGCGKPAARGRPGAAPALRGGLAARGLGEVVGGAGGDLPDVVASLARKSGGEAKEGGQGSRALRLCARLVERQVVSQLV